MARERFEQSCADPANYLRQPWSGALRAIFAQQGSVQKYLELVEQTELTAGDGETIAGMFQAKRRLDEALAWTRAGPAPGTTEFPVSAPRAPSWER